MKRAVAVITAFLLLASCASGKKVNKNKKDEGGGDGIFHKSSSKPVAVTSYTVTSREVPLVINADGHTEPSDRFEAKAPASAKIQKVFVDEGARVQPGDALVKFDDEIAKLKLSVANAEIQESEAAIAAINAEKGRAPAASSEEGVPEAQAKINEARLTFYQAQMDRAKAQVELFEKMTDQEQINSPIAGVVMKRNATEGIDVTENQVLLEVVRTDPLYFTFKVHADDVTSLDKGAELSIKLAGAAGQELTGEIAVVGEEAEGGGAGVPVKVKLANPEGSLKSDMRGTVVVRTQGKKKIFSVPETAVVKTEHSNYVFKIDAGKARKAYVELGESYNGQPTITKGLVDGDVIVSTAEDDLADGSVVEIQATKSALQ